jgi:hypothetical protein
MPFSKHIGMVPALTETMRTAFDEICKCLDMNCDVDNPLTAVIVEKIVARAGETDPNRLVRQVLRELRDRPAKLA